MTPPDNKGRRLGRGLEALLVGTISATPGDGGLRDISVNEISANPFQPRKQFNVEELTELQESLSANGLLQPITVRRSSTTKGWELVAGERRLRAATNLGWKSISAIEKTLDDRALLTLALVENLQRSDLNPIEEAEGYQRLVDEFSASHQDIAKLVGKNRSTVANALRILQLPAEIRNMIGAGALTAGHARALLAFGDAARAGQMAREIVERGLSVRDVERAVKQQPGKGPKRSGRKAGTGTTAEVRDVENRLRKRFQTDVKVTLTGPDRGSVAIQFYSSEDLERTLELMGVEGNSE